MNDIRTDEDTIRHYVVAFVTHLHLPVIFLLDFYFKRRKTTVLPRR